MADVQRAHSTRSLLGRRASINNRKACHIGWALSSFLWIDITHPVQRARARTWSDKHKASLRCFLSFWSAATGPGGIKGAQAKLVGQYFGVPTPKLPGASLLLCLLVFVVFLQPFALLCLFVFTLAVCGDLDAASLDFLIPAHSQEDDTAVIRSTQLQS